MGPLREHVLNYYSNASDDEAGPEIWAHAAVDLPILAAGNTYPCPTLELLEELRQHEDWLDPEDEEEGEELRVRAQLRELSVTELAVLTINAFREAGVEGWRT